ncbi:MAG: STAS domain-containing protein [bacterium]
MKIKHGQKGSYNILRVRGTIDPIEDLKELKSIILEMFEQGKMNFAIQFENTQYIYSGALAILIGIYKGITPRGGKVAIIEPSETVKDLWDTFNLFEIIPLIDNEDKLE